MLLYLFSRIALAKVDGDAADLLRLLKTLRYTVDDVDLGCATQHGRVGSHETNGASTEDGDGLARLETGELDTMPALMNASVWTYSYASSTVTYSREDVCEKSEVFFVFFAGWELESIEVGEGNADVFSLSTGVRAHGDIAIRTTH